MKKTLRTAAALLLCLSILMSLQGVQGFALTQEEWNSYWQTSSATIDAGVIVAPGQYESERRFSWYSGEYEGDCEVKISLNADMSNAMTFTGVFEETPQGDRSNEVVATGLLPGKTYYYTCNSGDFTSPIATITTLVGDDFSALYVSDVHISKSDEDAMAVRDNAYKFHSVIDEATGRRADLALILSAGDQASAGLREEYVGYAASPLFKNLTTAITIGNHDKKYIDYKYFTNNPEINAPGVNAYIGSDYWFVKGDALFLIMDSNNADADYHRSFIRRAVRANPDVKWRIAMFHHDLFGGRIESRESENELLRLIWLPIFDEFAVDLALFGHSHYYTVSNVIYKGESVMDMEAGSVIENAPGTVYMVTGSINRPRELDDGEVPPLGQNVGYSYLSGESIYNVLTFSETSITVNSYTLGTQDAFNTFTLTKNSQQGGHPDELGAFYNFILRFIGKVVAIFGNIGDAYDMYDKFGIRLPIFEALFG